MFVSKDYEDSSFNAPEGYDLIDVELYPTYEGFIFQTCTIYSNNTLVEATGVYNENTGTYEYITPGVPVTTKTLKPRE